MDYGDLSPVRSLVIVFSYHHKNTEKIAQAIAKVLDAPVRTPQEISPDELEQYDLIGFGSGIYGGTFHASVLDLAERLPQAGSRKTFIFSTYGAPSAIATAEFIRNNHRQIRERLVARGYEVTGEFGCGGWNTNSFLTYFGGLNKGRPDAEDLRNAGAFARSLTLERGQKE